MERTNQLRATVIAGILATGVFIGFRELLPSVAADPPLATPETAPSEFDYHDDHDGRNLADVRLSFVRQGQQRALLINISAVGPFVDPIPGFRGVRGANRYTAEELDLILSGQQAISVHTTHLESASHWTGSYESGERGHLPERRLKPNGRIDFQAVTELDYPLHLTIDTGEIRQGTQQTEVIVDGVPRLRVTFEVDGNDAHIVGFESLGDPEHLPVRTGTLRESTLAAAAQDKPTSSTKSRTTTVHIADWDSRDLEGKWVMIQSRYKQSPNNSKRLVAYLIEKKEFELLEWMVLYQRNALKQLQVGEALVRANAPQWVRAVTWARRSPRSLGHAEKKSRSLLVQHDPGFVFSWLHKYREDTLKSDRVKKDYVLLKSKNLKLQDVSKALPPLKASDVFKFLTAPAELAEFGNRLRAEPGKVYVHQVLRAIDGVIVSGLYEDPWIGKLHTLTQHSNPKVRQAAYLTMTYVARHLDLKKYSLKHFEKVIDDPKETPKIREAALMAFSFFDHPRVYVKLHNIARDTGHPSWKAAVSRLGDFGSGFTLIYLQQLSDAPLSASDAKLWTSIESNIRTIAERRAAKVRFKTDNEIRRMLERTAWADLTRGSMYEDLARWTIKNLAEYPNKNVSRTLEKIQVKYAPKFENKVGNGTMQERVRALAELIAITREANEKRRESD